MELDYLKGLFEGQKEFISYRFDELHKDLEERKKKDEEQDERIEDLEQGKWLGRGFLTMILGWFKF